jgi:diaminopimelate decarboxylase
MIAKNAKMFLDTFRKYYPDFAVKAIPNKHILSILKDSGMGFDCSSISELEMVLPISNDILYSSNYTSVEDLCQVLKLNVNIILNLDDIDGLYNLKTASHGYCMGCQYNSKLRSAEVLLGEKYTVLIREKEHICFESVDFIYYD